MATIVRIRLLAVGMKSAHGLGVKSFIASSEWGL